MYHKTLYKMIEGDTSGDYRRFIFTVCMKHDCCIMYILWCKVRIRTILGFSCANLGSQLCATIRTPSHITVITPSHPLPPLEMKEVSVFRGYSAGEPSLRLYIKNLSRQTTEQVTFSTPSHLTPHSTHPPHTHHTHTHHTRTHHTHTLAGGSAVRLVATDSGDI